eukprot:CAMPEP_0181220540 /NCGR_PEP_ID=MMETSP1096-20121128/28895_1 /TAXON_ID=156174 ORGANISM="Chrysochromulina ericina, Strain CCMP281" /NCGR_SAMPLE_ID=MMETSP1096 /ASSEMBLY_ACC=CAM_ASM_000453 /LENGTH=114 /DNA_ID=CAMNT_0023313057 /DNA_START=499 /DNA_END=843 /DNA_ORIENTATION=-
MRDRGLAPVLCPASHWLGQVPSSDARGLNKLARFDCLEVLARANACWIRRISSSNSGVLLMAGASCAGWGSKRLAIGAQCTRVPSPKRSVGLRMPRRDDGGPPDGAPLVVSGIS